MDAAWNETPRSGTMIIRGKVFREEQVIIMAKHRIYTTSVASVYPHYLTKAEKKGDREAREGLVEAYVHGGRIGVIVEVNCETDFVGRLPEFKEYAHQIAMQIAAMNPEYVSEDDIPAEEKDRVRAEMMASDALKDKPEDMRAKIVDGQVNKYFSEKAVIFPHSDGYPV